MQSQRVAAAVASIMLTLSLVACGGQGSLVQEQLADASGVKVTAQNATSQQSATTGGAITVKEGEVIVASPYADKGSFHLTITSSDGATTVYDDDVSGKVLFTIAAAPGSYDVKTSGNDVTGSMTVSAMSAAELLEQDAKLGEELAKLGVDPSIAPNASQSN